MFARAGNDGGDDPYNFDIVGGYGGGGSKKSKKSKLGGRASLNKTVGASPSTSSLIPQASTPAQVACLEMYLCMDVDCFSALDAGCCYEIRSSAGVAAPSRLLQQLIAK